MPKLLYKKKRFSPLALELIERANGFIEDYQAQGFKVSLRQLYYAFVSADAFPASWADPATGSTNNEKSYGKLGDVVNDGRMAGLIDWDAIEDRGRHVRSVASWDDAADVVEAVSQQFKQDLWRDQPCRVEVWIEKDALVGVIEPVCRELRVPYFSCRGYTSASAMWGAARRFLEHLKQGHRPVVLHLGDHDPSGIDMTRDIQDRINNDFVSVDWIRERMIDTPAKRATWEKRFPNGVTMNAVFDDIKMATGGRGVEIRRLALNMDQVTEYDPPPNPTKVTDSRCKGYRECYGDDCWELDALTPAVLAGLIRANVASVRDDKLWKVAKAEEDRQRATLELASQNWKDVEKFLKDGKGKSR